MGQTIYQIDAFADRPFAGNPAAVCVLKEAADESWMQNVAMEMNLAETAYLVPESGDWRLRWFTPVLEVDLCGHATLASAFVLWETGQAPKDAPLRFQTRSGLLTCRRDGDAIEMDFPADPPEEAFAPSALLKALGVEAAAWVGRGRFDWLVEVESEAALRAIAPDFLLLAPAAPRGVVVTSRSETEGFDFMSRFFAPAAGINEDPATGSTHCCLAPYWAKKLGKTEMVAYQASARGGVIGVRMEGERVALRGRAVLVLRGELL